MEIIPEFGWIFYCGDMSELKRDKCGKWMYFFSDVDFAAEMCEKAVKENVVCEAKHTDDENGVACFYLNCDDEERHKKILGFFIDNGLIRKTKTGKLYNISFKFDNQTRAGEYGEEFESNIKLENFVDLQTGKWIR